METLQTAYGTFTVYLNHLNSDQENLFHISFICRNKLHVVLMQESTEGWIFLIPQGLPAWIIELQGQFDLLITRELLRKHVQAA